MEGAGMRALGGLDAPTPAAAWKWGLCSPGLGGHEFTSVIGVSMTNPTVPLTAGAHISGQLPLPRHLPHSQRWEQQLWGELGVPWSPGP